MAYGYKVEVGVRWRPKHFDSFLIAPVVNVCIFSFVWSLCSEIACMGSIRAPDAPIEWKLRGKASLSSRKPPEPENLFRSDISRENRAQIRSNFPGGVLGTGGKCHSLLLGHPRTCARPGSTDCPGAWMQRARGDHVRVEQRGPDSNLTLHYLWLCSYYAMKVMVQKILANLPAEVELRRGATYRGCAGRRGAVLGASRGKFRFFASFCANCEKPPPPRLEPVTAPIFARGIVR